MSLYEELIKIMPELSDDDFRKNIILRNDSDGLGDYIDQWNHPNPIPAGFQIGKPIK